MKILISIILSGLISSASIASEKDYDRCDQIETNSRKIMQLRQGTTPMKTMIKIVKETFEGSKSLNMQIAIVTSAYKQPRYSTDRMKKRAVEDFANDVYLECLTSS